VAFAFVPGRGTFLDRLAGGKFSDQTAADMDEFVSQFGGLLAEIHQFLVGARAPRVPRSPRVAARAPRPVCLPPGVAPCAAAAASADRATPHPFWTAPQDERGLDDPYKV
jgi:hypothetical protein